MINLSSSSDEVDLIAATSRDFEFAQMLFGELNRAVLGPPVMTRSSSSATPMKRRCVRRRLLTPKMQLLLLQSTLPQPPPLMATMPLRGQKIIIVMIRALIKWLAVMTVAVVMPVSLRRPRQEAEASVLQGELQWFRIVVPPFVCAKKLG
jgi:hypothetical protein